jgi:hypothetical protein|tara:strand:- start:1068 stop:1394 length:327 start_codon:yes stop_codon:yes gene_type:complete
MISSCISKKTLNELDKIINDYKIKVLDDINIHFNLNINKHEFINMFLERNQTVINIKKTTINYDNCNAIVYYKKYGYNQCKRKKNEGDYCSLHSKNRFYGTIKSNLEI